MQDFLLPVAPRISVFFIFPEILTFQEEFLRPSFPSRRDRDPSMDPKGKGPNQIHSQRKETPNIGKIQTKAVFVSLRPESPSQQVFTQNRTTVHQLQSHIHPPHGICMGNMNKVQRKKVLFSLSQIFRDFSYFFSHTLITAAGHSSQQLIVNPDDQALSQGAKYRIRFHIKEYLFHMKVGLYD